MESTLHLHPFNAVPSPLAQTLMLVGSNLLQQVWVLSRFQGPGWHFQVASNERTVSLPARVNKKESGGRQED